MNVKRILTITLAALFVCLACVGVASAFTYSANDYHVNPTGSLVPGAEVTASMLVDYQSAKNDAPNRLNFNSDLTGVSWTVVKNPGEGNNQSYHRSYPYEYLDNFDIYDASGSVTLLVTVSGYVSSDSAGKSIRPLTLSESGGSGSVFQSPTQFVYDTGVLAGNLQTLNSGITSLDSTISELVAAGYDCSAAKANLETARAKYQAAVSAGTEQGVAAFGYYEEGSTALNSARESLAYAILSIILGYTSQIDNNITQLYANGWNTEAKLVDTKNTAIKTSYDSCLKEYQAKNSNIANLVSLRNEAVALNTEAGDYVIQSQNPFGVVGETLGNIWPFIVVGVVAIVVGIIVFFLIRRRKNSWDELG